MSKRRSGKTGGARVRVDGLGGLGRYRYFLVSLGQSLEDGVDLLGNGCQGKLKLVLETTGDHN